MSNNDKVWIQRATADYTNAVLRGDKDAALRAKRQILIERAALLRHQADSLEQEAGALTLADIRK